MSSGRPLVPVGEIAMSPLNFFYPVLDALNDGRVIRRAVGIALQVIAVFTFTAGAIGIITILKFAFASGTSTEATIGGLLYAAIFAAMTISVFQVFRYRAGHIAELGESPFTVMPIMSILFRCVGEVYATILVGFGAGAFVLALFAADAAGFLIGRLDVLPGVPSGSPGVGLLGGLASLALFAVLAFGSLVFFYFLAEVTLVASDVARNIRLLVEAKPGLRATTGAAVGAVEAIEATASMSGQPSARTCPACSAEVVEEGTVFCTSCGARLASA